MIRVGGTYRFSNEMHRPFVFAVVGAVDDFRNSPKDDCPKEGFVCLVMLGVAMLADSSVQPGGTFRCARHSSISIDSVPYDGSDP